MSTKLLFADDSVTMQKVMQLTLENEDVNVLLVGNGREAFSIAESEKPNIIIADISMPDLDGFTLCEKLKQTPSTAGIPVILISGELEQYDDERGKEVGADFHMTKPFKSEELIKTIKNFAIETEAGPPADPDISERQEEAEDGTPPPEPTDQPETAETTAPEAEGEPDDPAEDTDAPAVLELTPSGSTPPEAGDDAMDESDEELEIVDDNFDLDEDIDDENEDDFVNTDELDIDGLEELSGDPAPESEVEGVEETESLEKALYDAIDSVETASEELAEDEGQPVNVLKVPEPAEIIDAGVLEIDEIETADTGVAEIDQPPIEEISVPEIDESLGEKELEIASLDELPEAVIEEPEKVSLEDIPAEDNEPEPEVEEAEDDESIEEILKEEIETTKEAAELQEEPDVTDRILSEVLEEPDTPEPPVELDVELDVEDKGETGIAPYEEVATETEEKPGEEEVPKMDDTGSEPDVWKNAAAGSPVDMDDALRESIAHAVSDFLKAEGPSILKESLRESMDRNVDSIFKSELESALREELKEMLGENLRLLMPEMLKMTEKITSQITPRIAEEMIKLAIEQIKKGDN